VTECIKIFELGCLRPTHEKITTLLADRGTVGQGHGPSEATQHALRMDGGPSSLLWVLGKRQLPSSAYSFSEANRISRFAAVYRRRFRPLRVEGFAEILTFDFREGPIPKLREDCLRFGYGYMTQ